MSTHVRRENNHLVVSGKVKVTAKCVMMKQVMEGFFVNGSVVVLSLL